MIGFFTFGLLLGAVVAIALAARLPHRALFGGAALITVSLFYLAFTWSSVERCAEFARQPNAGCQMYGTEEFVAVMLLPLVVGFGLIASSLWRGRRRRGV